MKHFVGNFAVKGRELIWKFDDLVIW